MKRSKIDYADLPQTILSKAYKIILKRGCNTMCALLSDKYFVAALFLMANTSPSVSSKVAWIDLIDESVHTSDDVDIGDIDAVSRDFLVVKRGFLKVHYYYIPISKVEGWDGFVLWLKVTEEEVKKNYERETIPDPSRYYVKDFPGYIAVYPEVEVIMPRYTRPVYTTKNSTPEGLRVYLCDLCRTAFDTEEELSRHVNTSH